MKQLNKTAYNFSISLILIPFYIILNFLNKKESSYAHAVRNRDKNRCNINGLLTEREVRTVKYQTEVF